MLLTLLKSFSSVFFDTSSKESDERGNGDTAESERAAGPDEDEYGGSTDEEAESAQPTPAEPQPGTVSFLTLRIGIFSSVADRVWLIHSPLSSEELWQLKKVNYHVVVFFH